MAQHELTAALRREGDAEVHKIWQRVETEAAQLRRESDQAVLLEQQVAGTRLQREINARQNALLSKARKQAQEIRLVAEDTLSKRLESLAKGLLEEFSFAGGTELFQALAAEIPDYPWQRVRCNARDLPAAISSFPNAEVLADKGISSGLEVQGLDEKIRIINTLEKRLAHLWPDLLPDLLKELRPMAGDDETFT